jgi:hypothetical protein
MILPLNSTDDCDIVRDGMDFVSLYGQDKRDHTDLLTGWGSTTTPGRTDLVKRHCGVSHGVYDMVP